MLDYTDDDNEAYQITLKGLIVVAIMREAEKGGQLTFERISAALNTVGNWTVINDLARR